MVLPVSAKKQTHIAVGNLNLDISVILDKYPPEDSHVFARGSWIGLGGAASNYAVAVAKAGHKSLLVARAGGDAVKLGLLDLLEAQGVSTEYVKIVPHESTGTVIVLVVPPRSSRTIVTIRGANELLSPTQIPNIEADVLHYASVRPEVIASSCDRRAKLKSYDPGGEVYRSNGFAKALSCLDVLLVNERELDHLIRGLGLREYRDLLDYGIKYIAVKMGAGGAKVFCNTGTSVIAYPPKQRRVVDVTGAGDTFNALFNASIVAGLSCADIARYAVAAGSAKVHRRGSSNMPREEEILRLIDMVKVEPI